MIRRGYGPTFRDLHFRWMADHAGPACGRHQTGIGRSAIPVRRPKPTDFKHFEIYAFTKGVPGQGGQSGASVIDFNYRAAPNLQLTAVLPYGFSNPAGDVAAAKRASQARAARRRAASTTQHRKAEIMQIELCSGTYPEQEHSPTPLAFAKTVFWSSSNV